MGVFERIVCGVDGSAPSLEAARQCATLLEPGGRLVLVSVVDLARAIRFQVAPTPLHALRRALDEVELLDREASEALERARAAVGPGQDVAVLKTGGPPAGCLFDVAADERATLVAVGTHGLGRAAGMLLGSVATRVLDGASCSVLVARNPAGESWRPRTVVVGVDGSPQAEAALAACRDLEARLGAQVRPVTVADDRPAHQPVEAARDADLLAVGTRGARPGPGRLRGVAVHVAHDARCSVLVVRDH